MPAIRSGLSATSIVVAALLVAGCGGTTSKADYEAEVGTISRDVQEDLEQLDSGPPSPELIKEAQGSLEEAADALEGIEPPKEVSGLHDDLVDVMRDTAGLFDDLEPLMAQATEDPSSMGKDELERMTAVTEEFAGIEKRMAKIQRGFDKKEYEIGLGDPASDGAASGDTASGEASSNAPSSPGSEQ